MEFPEKYQDLLDDNYLLVNTAVGRVKDHNIKARPQVAICVADPDDPYRYVQVRGKVVEYTTEGANEHIDNLAWKYQGVKKYDNYRPGMQRIIYKILPGSFDEH